MSSLVCLRLSCVQQTRVKSQQTSLDLLCSWVATLSRVGLVLEAKLNTLMVSGPKS